MALSNDFCVHLHSPFIWRISFLDKHLLNRVYNWKEHSGRGVLFLRRPQHLRLGLSRLMMSFAGFQKSIVFSEDHWGSKTWWCRECVWCTTVQNLQIPHTSLWSFHQCLQRKYCCIVFFAVFRQCKSYHECGMWLLLMSVYHWSVLVNWSTFK